MEIKGMEKDMEKMFALTAIRSEKIASTPAAIDLNDPIKNLVQTLHPAYLNLRLDSIIDETATTRTFRFLSNEKDKPLPYFRAGQYISLKPIVGNTKITRPYTISSAPHQAESFYELTIRHKENGFLTDHIWNKWKPGITVDATGPHGNFYFDPLRDKNSIIALAGGSGITPFRSMIRSMFNGRGEVNITLVYGNRIVDDIIFHEELQSYADQNPKMLEVIYVISEPSGKWNGRTGFIDGELIRELAGNLKGNSYFICGPPEMHGFCLDQLSSLNIPQRLIRQEITGPVDDITTDPDFPKEYIGKTFTISYQLRGKRGKLKAAAVETVLTAFEKAGLGPESQCRSGECGYCRSRLLSGDVFIESNCDGRRAADFKYGYIHPCSTYPLSELEVVIT